MLQAGADVWVSDGAEDKEKPFSTFGLTASLGNSKSKMYNRDRINGRLDAFTGKLDAEKFSLGAYYTKYKQNASYLDVVAQIGTVSNEFNDIYGAKAKQEGTTFALSAEVGKPFKICDCEWTLEPQAQLSYQRSQYKAFRDSVSDIAALSVNNLRARIGVRLYLQDVHTSDDKTKPTHSKLYFIGNILKDLRDTTTSIKIGGTDVFERISTKPWAEVGVGSQFNLSENTHLYGQMTYQRSLGSNEREGVSGRIGFRMQW